MRKLSHSWVAGFWEGEGCISKRKDRGFTVTIPQALQLNRRVEGTMKSLKNKYGGEIYYPKIGKIHWKQQLEWRVNKREDVLNFLKCIYPYCYIRQHDVKEAIIFLKNHPRNYNIKQINRYRKLGYSWLKISKLIKVSLRTIYRIMHRNLVKTKLQNIVGR